MKEKIKEFGENLVFEHEFDDDTGMEVRKGISTDFLLLSVTVVIMIILMMSI